MHRIYRWVLCSTRPAESYRIMNLLSASFTDESVRLFEWNGRKYTTVTPTRRKKIYKIYRKFGTYFYSLTFLIKFLN